MTMPRIDLLLFDLDGTLAHTAPELALAVNAALAQVGLGQVDDGQVQTWIGGGTRDLMLRAVAGAQGLSVDAARVHPGLAASQQAFDLHYQRLAGSACTLFPGVAPVLQALTASGVHMALLTNKEQRFVTPVLAHLGLSGALHPVVAGDTLPTRKPDPAGALLCLAAHGVAPQHALLVGDSATDAATARAAGLPVWLLDWGYNGGQDVRDCHPDRVISRFDALLELVAARGLGPRTIAA